MNVAEIIRDQIRSIDRCALMAWGAKEFVNMGDGLKFKVGGLAKYKGYVYVKYDRGADAYNIEFFRIRKCEVKVDKKFEGIYADQLVEIIDEVVQ